MEAHIVLEIDIKDVIKMQLSIEFQLKKTQI